jgi:hypothetical protein
MVDGRLVENTAVQRHHLNIHLSESSLFAKKDIIQGKLGMVRSACQADQDDDSIDCASIDGVTTPGALPKLDKKMNNFLRTDTRNFEEETMVLTQQPSAKNKQKTFQRSRSF